MNMIAPANTEAPTAQIVNESNCDVCGYGFRQCAIFISFAFSKNNRDAGWLICDASPVSGYLI
jgi:hypothetical protein